MNWGGNDESDKGSVEAQVLLDGMLEHDRLLDIVENFILFDSSKPGATRKVIARNHQVLGVNNAVESVREQQELKLEFPPEKRLAYRVIELPKEEATDADMLPVAEAIEEDKKKVTLDLVVSAHPKLGRNAGGGRSIDPGQRLCIIAESAFHR